MFFPFVHLSFPCAFYILTQNKTIVFLLIIDKIIIVKNERGNYYEVTEISRRSHKKN